MDQWEQSLVGTTLGIVVDQLSSRPITDNTLLLLVQSPLFGGVRWLGHSKFMMSSICFACCLVGMVKYHSGSGYIFLFSGPWGFYSGHFKNFLCMYEYVCRSYWSVNGADSRGDVRIGTGVRSWLGGDIPSGSLAMWKLLWHFKKCNFKISAFWQPEGSLLCCIIIWTEDLW